MFFLGKKEISDFKFYSYACALLKDKESSIFWPLFQHDEMIYLFFKFGAGKGKCADAGI